MPERRSNRSPWLAAGTLMGVGLGAFVDGILFHQILQLHSMLSNRLPQTTVVNIQVSMVWDGLFHAFCWVSVVVALWLSWRTLVRGHEVSGRAYVGSMLLGWGLFNLIEGILDHQILAIHHVYQNGSHLGWDLVFLASGVVHVAWGWRMVRSARWFRQAPVARSPEASEQRRRPATTTLR